MMVIVHVARWWCNSVGVGREDTEMAPQFCNGFAIVRSSETIGRMDEEFKRRAPAMKRMGWLRRPNKE